MAAPKGNDYNLKYTLEKELPIFEDLLKKTEEGEFLCIQEIIMKSPYPKKSFYYLCEKFQDLHNLKEEMNDAIIVEINRGSLNNKYNSTASIWRQKQLGERDQQHQDITTNGNDVQEKTIIRFVTKRR